MIITNLRSVHHIFVITAVSVNIIITNKQSKYCDKDQLLRKQRFLFYIIWLMIPALNNNKY